MNCLIHLLCMCYGGVNLKVLICSWMLMKSMCKCLSWMYIYHAWKLSHHMHILWGSKFKVGWVKYLRETLHIHCVIISQNLGLHVTQFYASTLIFSSIYRQALSHLSTDMLSQNQAFQACVHLSTGTFLLSTNTHFL